MLLFQDSDIGMIGFSITPSYWDDVQSFISYWKIFNLHSPAFGALAGYSRDENGIRAVSLAETFERAAYYAVKEPGGETIRLMRSAISQIADEIKNPEFIKARLQERRAIRYQEILDLGFDSEDSWDAANPSLGDSFQDMNHALGILECPEDLLKELDKVKSYSKTEEHSPIVYAVRILKSDMSQFSSDGAGFNYRGIFPPKRLLARVPISGDRVILQPGFVNQEQREARRKWSKRKRRYGGRE